MVIPIDAVPRGRLRELISTFLIMNVIAVSSLRSARSEDAETGAPTDDGFRTRASIVDQILGKDALLTPPYEDGLAVRAAAMSEAADLARAKFGETHWLTRWSRTLAGGLKSVSELPVVQQELFEDAMNAKLRSRDLDSEGKDEAALRELRRAREKMVAAVGQDHVLAVYLLSDSCAREYLLGAHELAKTHAQAILPLAAKQWGKDHPEYGLALRNLAWAECALHEYQAAVRHITEAITILEPIAAEGLSDFDTRNYALANLVLARARNEQGEFSEAEMPARRALALLAPYSETSYPDMLASLVEVARSESGQEKYTQADITFGTIRRLKFNNLPGELATDIEAAIAEHLHRARPAGADKSDRGINRQ